MPSINEVIERVDKVKPNVYDEEQKAEWLARLDGRISREILKMDLPVRYIYPEDGDKDLLVPYPYDDMYDYFLKYGLTAFVVCFIMWSMDVYTYKSIIMKKGENKK